MTVHIGIPRGLLYYYHGRIWEEFLRNLGADVIVSGETSKKTLQVGRTLDEVCLPVKAYFGHVYEISRDVDYLFVPRIVSVSKGQYTCPEIIGLPDMLRSNIPHLPKLLDVPINLRKDWRNLYQGVITVGKILKAGRLASLYAWHQAWQLKQQKTGRLTDKGASLRIGLIGQPYMIHDRQLSMGMLDKLRNLKVDVVIPEMVDAHQARKAAACLDKKIFWCYCSHLAGTALALLQRPAQVDGVIFMTPFSCGPDSLIGEILKGRAQTCNVPFMFLTIDEHTAEAGFITRLEAFIDMLGRRQRL